MRFLIVSDILNNRTLPKRHGNGKATGFIMKDGKGTFLKNFFIISLMNLQSFLDRLCYTKTIINCTNHNPLSFEKSLILKKKLYPVS